MCGSWYCCHWAFVKKKHEYIITVVEKKLGSRFSLGARSVFEWYVVCMECFVIIFSHSAWWRDVSLLLFSLIFIRFLDFCSPFYYCNIFSLLRVWFAQPYITRYDFNLKCATHTVCAYYFTMLYNYTTFFGKSIYQFSHTFSFHSNLMVSTSDTNTHQIRP